MIISLPPFPLIINTALISYAKGMGDQDGGIIYFTTDCQLTLDAEQWTEFILKYSQLYVNQYTRNIL
jgi:hypothetical protein